MALIQPTRKSVLVFMWNDGSPVPPFLDLSMAVTKGKPGCTVVKACREVDHAGAASTRVTFHSESCIVDAVGMLVQKDK